MKKFLCNIVLLASLLMPSFSYGQTYGVGLVPHGTEPPATCKSGSFFWDDDDNTLYICELSTWILAGSGGGVSFTNESELYDLLSDVDNFTQGTVTETITSPWTFSYGRLTAVEAALGSIATGDIFRTNPASYDPGGIGGSTNYRALKTDTGYMPLFDDAGNMFGSSTQVPIKVCGSDSNGRVLTAAELNCVWVATGAGDWDIPENQCDTATGQFLIIRATTAALTSVTSDDAADQFVDSSGTAYTAGHEIDTAGAAGNVIFVKCIEANKWHVMGEIGTCVDGDVAD